MHDAIMIFAFAVIAGVTPVWLWTAIWWFFNDAPTVPFWRRIWRSITYLPWLVWDDISERWPR